MATEKPVASRTGPLRRRPPRKGRMMEPQLLRAVGTEDRPHPLGPLSGTTISGYQLGSLIGRGGMSEVYEAFDPRLGRHVALKVLDKELARSGSFRERFIRESRLAASLSHPNVIPIFEAGSEGEMLFIAMHLVQGSDLGSLISARGCLSPLLTREVLRQAASALDEAHECGLLHRDVKPGNLLVTAERTQTPHVYLTDFGLTKSLGRDSRITETGQLLGSVHYVSPEHVEGREMDHRADVYSLGCVLFECLTGSVPYERDSDMSVLWAHLNAEIPRPSKKNRKLPNLVDRVVARALAKDPEERFETCGQLVESFSAALDGAPVFLPVPQAPAKTPGRVRRVAKRAAVVATSVTLAGGLGAWAFTDLGRPPSTAAPQERALGKKAASPRNESRIKSAEARNEQRDEAEVKGRNPRQQSPSSKARADGTGGSGGGSSKAPAAPLAASLDEGLQMSRTLSSRYDVTTSDLRGLRDCTPDDTAQGCIVFSLRRDETHADVSLRDDAGFPVHAWVRQDGDGDGRWEGAWKRVCGHTQQPLKVVGGSRIQVLVDEAACDGESPATTGLIEVTLYRGAT